MIRAQRVMHGKLSSIVHDQRGVFADVPSPFNATRYHSLAIERASAAACLEVTATAEDGEIMGVRHRELPVEGVQFHPEAILTEHGQELLAELSRCDRLNSRSGRPLPADARYGFKAMAITLQEALQRTIEHREIFHDEMLSLMRRIMSGEVSPVMIAALTVGLRVKKETIGEIAAAAQVMREFATQGRRRRHARTWSTSSAPAATRRTRSTSRRRRCSSPPRPARASPSTATAGCRRSPAAPTCSRRSAPTSS